jgi:catalase
MAPEEAVRLSAEEAARKPRDFLEDDLPKRIAKRPVVFPGPTIARLWTWEF